MLEKKKHCQTWHRLSWMRRQKQSAFGQEAQSALDSAEVVETVHGARAPGARGALYRAGLTLADLRPGECGDVRRLIGSTQGRLRLLEMGLTPGTHVRMIRAAAFGGPVDIQVRGYQLSLRREEAASVWLDDAESEK